jgi:hypothetical protein
MENQIDEHFKDRLSEAEVSPDPGLWKRIENTMAARRVRRFRIYSTAAMLVFAFAALLRLWLVPIETKQDSHIVQSSDPVPDRNSELKVEIINPEHLPAPVKQNSDVKQALGQPKAVTQVSAEPEEQDKVNSTEYYAVSQDTEVLSSVVVTTEQQGIIQPQPEVLVYELAASEESIVQQDRQFKLYKLFMGLKRDGISLGAIQDLKTGIFNRLNRGRQRYDDSQLKFQTTEQ